MRTILSIFLSLLLSGCIIIDVFDSKNTQVYDYIEMNDNVPQMQKICDIVNNSSKAMQMGLVDIAKNETILIYPDKEAMEQLITKDFPIDIGLKFSKYTKETSPCFNLTLEKNLHNCFKIYTMCFPEPASSTKINMKLSYDALFCFTKLVIKRNPNDDYDQKIFLERIRDTWQVVGFYNRYRLHDENAYIYKCWGKVENFNDSDELRYYHYNCKNYEKYKTISKEQFDAFFKNNKIRKKCKQCKYIPIY